jgi:peptide chain release factor 1
MSQDRLSGLLDEYAELEKRLADPAIHADQNTARRVGRRFAVLAPVHKAAGELEQARADLIAARELAAEDPSFGGEADAIAATLPALEERLAELLIPRDPHDAKDVIVEIKAGEGGEESALFAGDLLRMYSRYAERHGWVVEVIDAQDSDLGGVKDVSLAVKTRGVPEGGNGVWSRLKWEGGVHRVQRVPVTESQGRIHTSAAGVLVLPEAEDVDVTIEPGDIRVDVFRSSGPGGQSVNTTDSAVRITHLPTGIVVSCQNEKSQLQNREQAMRILRARLLAAAQEQADSAASDARKAQVRTVDRSERIRTYNYPQNRITDHRIGYTAYNLDLVLAGDLDAVLDALAEADRAARLAGETELSRRCACLRRAGSRSARPRPCPGPACSRRRPRPASGRRRCPGRRGCRAGCARCRCSC